MFISDTKFYVASCLFWGNHLMLLIFQISLPSQCIYVVLRTSDIASCLNAGKIQSSYPFLNFGDISILTESCLLVLVNSCVLRFLDQIV